MTGLIELVAANLGWTLARANIIVEGTSDVAYFKHASDLHRVAHGSDVINQDFTIVAAGQGDDGGVHGVSRRLTAMLQIAEMDRSDTGALRFRFGGLYDNDYAGKTAFDLMSLSDPRIEKYKDTFLLRPVMPSIGDGISSRLIEATTVNLPYPNLDWEIEDLCSERLMLKFEAENPNAVTAKVDVKGRRHRDIERPAKAELVRLFVAEATIEDAKHFLALLKSLRGYMGVPYAFVNA